MRGISRIGQENQVLPKIRSKNFFNAPAGQCGDAGPTVSEMELARSRGALENGGITLRGYDRILRAAWTVADIAGKARPDADDIEKALRYRRGAV